MLGLAAAVAVAWKGDKLVDKVLDWRFGATLEKPSFPPPRDAAEANLQDLEYLSRLLEVDRSFSDAARAAFTRRVAALQPRSGDLTRAQLLMAVAEAVAVSDNPHTNVERGAWRSMLNSSPVRFEWFAEGLFVIRATTANVALLGARVTSIDGFDPEVLAREASRYFGGPPEHGRVNSLLVLESPQALHVLHAEAPEDRIVLRMVDVDGAERAVELPAIDPKVAPEAVKPGRLLSPMTNARETPGEWHGILDARNELPPSLRDPNRSLYATRLADSVLYLHLWQIRDDGRGPVERDLMKALGAPSDRPWRRIVLDLRFDTGGDYPAVYSALRELPKRLAPDGKLAIVTDNTTFSAAIISAALAKVFTGPRAVVVGERPRDRLVFWAEGNSIRLPNSKIEITTSTALHDWEHGCRVLACFWPNYFYDVAAGTVEPDIKVAWRFDDYRRGIDTVLRRAME
jgi:hypothetical protein